MAVAKDPSRDESKAACWVATQDVQTAAMKVVIPAAVKGEKPLAASWAHSSDIFGEVAAAAAWADLRDLRGQAAAMARRTVADQQAAQWDSEQV
jgi:hypothetical protein